MNPCFHSNTWKVVLSSEKCLQRELFISFYFLCHIITFLCLSAILKIISIINLVCCHYSIRQSRLQWTPTVWLWIVADFVAVIFQVMTSSMRVTMLEFTTISAIIYEPLLWAFCSFMLVNFPMVNFQKLLRLHNLQNYLLVQ